MRIITHVKTRANQTIADMATSGVAVTSWLCDQPVGLVPGCQTEFGNQATGEV